MSDRKLPLDKSERILAELLKIPVNTICCDCGAASKCTRKQAAAVDFDFQHRIVNQLGVRAPTTWACLASCHVELADQCMHNVDIATP
ncbi:hypothetical protein BGZ75_005850 [Mortierella antarctica]|nr:hypothetical protein BGZ75_005850 [Mortierella antarctica]